MTPMPLWFTRDVAKFRQQLASNEITRLEYDEGIERLNEHYEDRQREYRSGRG